MANDVTFTLPNRKLGNSDIQFLIKRDGVVLGKLLVSKGAVVWRSKNYQKGKKLGWKQFDRLMEENGRREK